MSFFRSVADSDSSSSEEELLSDSEEESGTEIKKAVRAAKEDNEGDFSEEDEKPAEPVKPRGRFLRDEDDESSSGDEEEIRVVKSAKDKRFEEMDGLLKNIENALKINDWNFVQNGEFIISIRIQDSF
jgi:translation initiation factor 3 subunit C